MNEGPIRAFRGGRIALNLGAGSTGRVVSVSQNQFMRSVSLIDPPFFAGPIRPTLLTLGLRRINAMKLVRWSVEKLFENRFPASAKMHVH
jgi:hypothetical protein